ncbi:MAG: GntR family transcriptional regulator [Ilumatobacteraceae bacterium]
MILTVDPTRALPVYEQIREQITRMVAAGTLRSGTRLPTIRQLSNDLGLAKGTIERAYELLESDAVVQTRGRLGTFVQPMTVTPKRDRIEALRAAADAVAIVARQLGATDDEAIDAVRHACRRLAR